MTADRRKPENPDAVTLADVALTLVTLGFLAMLIAAAAGWDFGPL